MPSILVPKDGGQQNPPPQRSLTQPPAPLQGGDAGRTDTTDGGGPPRSGSRPAAAPRTFSEAFSFVTRTSLYEPPEQLHAQQQQAPPQQRQQQQQRGGRSGSTSGSSASSSSTATAAASSSTSSEGRSALADGSGSAIAVNGRQKGNPLLKRIKNVAWHFVDGVRADFVLGKRTAALYLSLRYHLLHPQYLRARIAALREATGGEGGGAGDTFQQHIVLCLVDVDDCESALLGINRLVLRCRCTLVLAWSLAEAARYLETFKAYENKPATVIQERAESEFLPRLSEVLTAVRSVNKSDVATLLGTFGSLNGIANASMEEMALCPGIGEKKVERLYDALHEPFSHAKRGTKRGRSDDKISAGVDVDLDANIGDDSDSGSGADVGAVTGVDAGSDTGTGVGAGAGAAS